MSLQSEEQLRNNVKDKLSRGDVVASMAVRLVRSIEIAYIAKTAGFDTVYIDNEHGSFSLETTGQICLAALAIGMAPFVRVPAFRPDLIARSLEIGALGVIVPHIRSAVEARGVVAAAKFPPLGERSVSSAMPHFFYRSLPAAELSATLNQATMAIVQIETVDALEKVEEISAVNGIDMVFVGSNDLLADMGIPSQYGHDRHKDAYARVIRACQQNGKFVGIGGLSSRPDLVAEFVAMGARYVSMGTDLSFLLSAAAQQAKRVKELQP